MQAAQRAFGAWAAMSMAERAAMLTHISGQLNADAAETASRARLLTREHGKTLFETNIEVTRLADRFAQVANFAGRVAEEDEVSGKMFDTVVTRKSRGVSLLIVPWNWQFYDVTQHCDLTQNNRNSIRPRTSAHRRKEKCGTMVSGSTSCTLIVILFPYPKGLLARQ